MRYYVVVTIAIFGLVTGMLLSSPGPFVTGEEAGTEMALIIISDYNGGSQDETDKGLDLYDHLISDGYGHDDIILLAPWGVQNRDDAPTTGNIEDSFQDLIDEASIDTEVLIWISDHAGADVNGVYFQFTDGRITTSDMDDWMDDIDHEDMTVILGGDYSGLAGPDLYETGRTVISSMDHDQYFSSDLFDIARGLSDGTADLNNDGLVSYKEAYISESALISYSGQDPQIWED